MSHKIKNALYTINGSDVVIIEHEGKAWITWASLRDLLGFPPAASLPMIEKAIEGGLGEGFTKTLVPKPVNSTCMGWVLDLKSTITVASERVGNGKSLDTLLADIHRCFERFKVTENTDLPDSGEVKANSPPSSPQVNDEEAEASPEEEVVPQKDIQILCDKFDESMINLVKQLSENFEVRIQELEMVKYADQLGNMAERISNMEEQLHEYKAEMKDFHLLIRSLKESTGSQVQAETIKQLVGMLDKADN